MENKNGFLIKDLLIRLILIVIFIFLLIWLFPMPDLKPLNNQIFSDNLGRMRDVAKSYYTIERLPDNINESKKMTLKEMIDSKLILPLMDSNGNYCSEDASYIQITKLENEYVIKVYLSCSDKQDYIIEHFGCYDICSEKCKPSTTTTTKNNITTKNDGKLYEYQFVKSSCSEKFDKYVCADGYYLAGNKCIKNGSLTDVKPADKDYTNVTSIDTKDAKPVTEYEKENVAANCSDEFTSSPSINATPNTKETNQVVVKVQTVTANKKISYDVKGAIGTVKTIKADYIKVQNYDVITAAKYKTDNWQYVSTLTSRKGDLAFVNDNEKLVLVDSWAEDSCVGCGGQVVVYKYWRFKNNPTYTYSCADFKGYEKYGADKCRKATTITKKCPTDHEYKDTGSGCERKEVTYSCLKYGSDYTLNKDNNTCVKVKNITYSCPEGTEETANQELCTKKVYGCQTGTPTENNKCLVTTYSCPKDTADKKYKLSGTKCEVQTKTKVCKCPDGTKETSDKTVCEKTTPKTTYSCKDYPGYTKNGKECIKTITTKIPVYSCDKYKGYTLSGESCITTINTTDSKTATPEYKTVCDNVYKWSTKTSISGWNYTGNKRELK